MIIPINNNDTIALCDYCLEKKFHKFAEDKCLICNKDFCKDHRMNNFFSHVSYSIGRYNISICSECWDKTRYLLSNDLKKFFKNEEGFEDNIPDDTNDLIFYFIEYNINKMIENWLETYQAKIKFLIEEANSIYKDKIEQEKRKKIIEAELKELQIKERELKDKIK